MPYLMVNLDDPKDCRRAMSHLNGVLGFAERGPGGRCGLSGRGRPVHEGAGREPGAFDGRHGPRGRGDGFDGGNVLATEEAMRRIARGDKQAAIRALPLGAKLQTMTQRGVWQHLVAIARQGEVAKSLAEYDRELGLPANKMRSLKAIMAKLENKFDLRFLEPSPEAGQDEAGNPRYMMPCRIRNKILKIAGSA